MTSDPSKQDGDKPDRASDEFERLADQPHASIYGELASFLIENRLWILAPIIAALAILAVLVVLSSTGLAPFIYTLF